MHLADWVKAYWALFVLVQKKMRPARQTYRCFRKQNSVSVRLPLTNLPKHGFHGLFNRIFFSLQTESGHSVNLFQKSQKPQLYPEPLYFLLLCHPSLHGRWEVRQSSAAIFLCIQIVKNNIGFP